MDERLQIKQENGRPVLQTWVDGVEVIVNFSDEEPQTDLKKGIMRLIMQSYEDRVIGQKRKVEEPT
ncbi:MAG: hypothetical protein IKX20_02810 [Paludibacteraceae bacterium]|nr:hypothetical protein [Paludibacteraceae bacterium]